MINYLLPNHVYFCCQGDAIVFLDLKNDEYTMIDGSQASVFRTIFCATRDSLWPDGDSARNSVSEHSDSLTDMLQELIDGGLLSVTGSRCKPVLPTVTSPPTEHLFGGEGSTTRVRITHVFGFVVSCAIAVARLRFFHIETTICAVQQRRTLRSTKKSFDFDKARQLVGEFNRLRYWFPADYLCLFDSLALIEFLARYDVFPNWIFAVRPHFWGAHCWVQEGSVAFNESTERAEDYVPIMVV